MVHIELSEKFSKFLDVFFTHLGGDVGNCDGFEFREFGEFGHFFEVEFKTFLGGIFFGNPWMVENFFD